MLVFFDPIFRRAPGFSWPVLPGLALPLLLVGAAEYGAVQQFVRLTQWCRQDAASRTFILALAYLHFK